MAGYSFFPAADKAQDEIWSYSAAQWGEAQAESYIRGLHDHLQTLSENRNLWRKLPNSLIVPTDLTINAWFSRYERHYIFFREFSGSRIGVMSILQEKMDIPVRLAADLGSI